MSCGVEGIFYNLVLQILFQLAFRAEMNEEPLVETAAKIFQELVYSYRSTLKAGIIVAGWDRRKLGQVKWILDALVKVTSICFVILYLLMD